MADFRPTCPRCGERLRANARRCECGALTGLQPSRRPAAQHPPPEPRSVETTQGRYVVRETEGYRIAAPIKRMAHQALPGIECVVLDTAWNHRVVASFTSESYVGAGRNRRAMFQCAREAAATRCDLLNRLDEIARSKAA